MRSGVQARVLSLYRTVLRATRLKDAATRSAVAAFARAEFDKCAGRLEACVCDVSRFKCSA